MDYQKHYDLLINRALNREYPEVNEIHHIKPRCMGGKDRHDNYAALTPEEHYLAHQLLVKMYPEVKDLAIAALLMSKDNRNGKRNNNKSYGWLRKLAAKANSDRRTGIPLSESTKLKISEALKNSESLRMFHDSRIGVPRTEVEKQKMSDAAKTSPAAIAARKVIQENRIGTKASEEARANMSKGQLSKPPMTEETKRRISEALKGKPKSAEHSAKVSEALKGKPGTRKGVVLSDETKAKMRAAALGRKASKETVEKMLAGKTPEQRSEGAKKAWETKRKNKELQNGVQT